MKKNDKVINFILETEWQALPEDIQHQSKRCLLDTLGAMIAGHRTPVGDLMASFALGQFPGNEATIMVKGEKLSASGAALVNGFANNALDIDDGYRLVKGHPGACVLSVALAAGELKQNVTGQQFLTALVIGYEVSIRAGLIRHATYETYHSSGSWGAIGGGCSGRETDGALQGKTCPCTGRGRVSCPHCAYDEMY